MPLRSATIACEESSHIGTMSELERVSGVSAFDERVKSRVWDKRLYKHKEASGRI